MTRNGGVRAPGLPGLIRDLASLEPQLAAAFRATDQAAARMIAAKANGRAYGSLAGSFRAAGAGVSAPVPNSVSPFLKGTAQQSELTGWLPLYQQTIATVLGQLAGRTY